MKTLISLIILLLTTHLSVGQFFDESLTIDKKNHVPITIDGFQTSVSINSNIRNNRLVLGGIEELKEYKKRQLNFKLKSIDSMTLKNGNIQKVFQFEVAEIAFGSVLLQNFPVEFEYVINQKNGKSKLVSNHQIEVGLGYLRLFSNAQIEGNALKLEDIQCEYNKDPGGCNPINNSSPVVSQPAVIPANTQNVTVRIVPCSLTTDVTQIKSQVRNLFASSNVTIEEETNVPPPAKALNRVSDGVTIRYFANDDKDLAKDYLGNFSSS